MNPDQQRYVRYFNSLATAIDLPPGDPSALVARAAARRRRRRSVASGVAALALVAGAVSVQQIGGDDGARVAAEGDAVIAARPLQWTPVTPSAGLVYSNSSAVTEDGTQFGLSTAPGRHDPDTDDGRQTLYRSTDGVEWTAVALPDSLWPSQLASSGNDLYAVGTSPAAGGSRSVVLARRAAGADWGTVTLPIDLASLEQAAGVEVAVQALDVSAGPAGIVTAFQLQARTDPSDYIPADVAGAYYAVWTATGLDVYGAPEDCELVGAREIACDGSEPGPKPMSDERLLASYSFEQLGLGDALRSLIVGELHVFVSADGTSFDEVALPAGVHGHGTLVSTDDGYVLFASTWDRTGSAVTTLRSPDAWNWTVDNGLVMQGYVAATGTLGGRAAAIVSPERSGAVLQVQQPDGTWLPLDFGAAVAQLGTPPGAMIMVSAADIGPLGAAAVISAYDESAQSDQHFLVYSPDGRSISVQALADLPGAPQGYASSVRVSADAVTVAFGDDRYDDGVITSSLLVGTPT